MTKPYRMTTVAAAMALLALGAACEDEKTPEEKAQQQLEKFTGEAAKTTEEADKVPRRETGEQVDSVSDQATRAYEATRDEAAEAYERARLAAERTAAEASEEALQTYAAAIQQATDAYVKTMAAADKAGDQASREAQSQYEAARQRITDTLGTEDAPNDAAETSPPKAY